MDFNGKTVVITGASSGIGRETALLFASKKAKLVLVARNKKRLFAVEKECTKNGALHAQSFVCDVSNYSQVKKICTKILEKFGHVDVLVNNAGFGLFKPFEEQKIEEAEQLMKTNYFGTIYFTKELLTAMQSDSHIVNISSMAGLLAFPNYAAYGASKFAIAGFTESLHHELLHKGIGVHLVCPTGTQTHFFDNSSFDDHAHRKNFNKMMKASSVSEMILQSIEKNQLFTLPTLKERIVVLVKINLPWLYHFILQRNYLRRHVNKE